MEVCDTRKSSRQLDSLFLTLSFTAGIRGGSRVLGQNASELIRPDDKAGRVSTEGFVVGCGGSTDGRFKRQRQRVVRSKGTSIVILKVFPVYTA